MSTDFLDTLRSYQYWRRGADTPMPDPVISGIAIDHAIEIVLAAKHHVACAGGPLERYTLERLQALVIEVPSP